MSRILIRSNPIIERDFVEGSNVLRVSEFFYDTIQGEGIYVGHPAAFLRLQGCTLNCSYCDTKAIWKNGNPYTFTELFDLMCTQLVDKLRNGQHLVLTGGSPLLQQKNLIVFIERFISAFKFKPFIEVENECILTPVSEFAKYVDCWNNSPKLANSGMNGFRKIAIKETASLRNSWFKFVVNKEEDWEEINTMYIKSRLIQKHQVILMPEGTNKKELEQNRHLVVDLAIKNNVRYCSREHIVLWDTATGV